MQDDHPFALVRRIARGSTARLSSFRHREDEPHRDPEEESLSYPTVVFTTRGSWTFRSRDGAFDLDPARVLLVNAGESYSCRHPSSFPDDCTLSLELLTPHRVEFGRRWVPLTPRMSTLVGQMAHEERAARPGHRLAVDALAADLVVDLLRSEDRRAGDVPSHVDAARAYLEMSFRSEVALADVAAAAYMSVFHLGREFKKHVGQTPYQYLIALRVAEAQRLLRDTALPVTAVAEASGFNNLSHFITTFRLRTGHSPTGYRAASSGA